MTERPMMPRPEEGGVVYRREVRLRPRDDLGGRIPPEQIVTRGWPVRHEGEVPVIDLGSWRLDVDGLVKNPVSLRWEELLSLGISARTNDLHCVTHFTTLENRWEGVPVSQLLRLVEPLAQARFVLQRAHGGYTTNVPLPDFARDENLLATRHAGLPLSPEHGWPCRLVIPHLYSWKGAKWISGLTFLAHDEPGENERHGYHMRGDPWTQERFREDL